MQTVRIVTLAMAATIVYGLVHDQITARVCIEYFTIGHPRIIESRSPTLLALLWGIRATWWAGLLAGITLAIACRTGRWPKWGADELLRPAGVLLSGMAVVSLIGGIVGYALAQCGSIHLNEELAERLPSARHPLFLADLWAHNAAYSAGFLGTYILCGYILFKRRAKWSVGLTRQ